MVIEVTHSDRIPILEPATSPARAAVASESAPVPPAITPVSVQSNTAANANVVKAAVKQVQEAINSGPNPDFTLDYLSGLSVVTVRSKITGEVVYQLPDSRAVELARLLKEGTSLSSLGLLNTEA